MKNSIEYALIQEEMFTPLSLKFADDSDDETYTENLTPFNFAQKFNKNITKIIQQYLPAQEKPKKADCQIF